MDFHFISVIPLSETLSCKNKNECFYNQIFKNKTLYHLFSKGFEARGTDIKSRITSWNFYLAESEPGKTLSFYPTLHDSDDYFEESASDDRVVRDLDTMGYLNEPADSTGRGSSSSLSSSSSSYSYDDAEPSYFCSDRYGDLDARIAFTAEAKHSLFSVEAIQSVCEVDQRLRSHIDFDRHCLRQNFQCCPSKSLGNYITLLRNKSSCFDIQQEDVTYTLELLQFCAGFFHNRTLSRLCWDYSSDSKRLEYCYTVPTNCTRFNAVYMMFQYILSIDFLSVANPKNTEPSATLLIAPITKSESHLKKLYEDNFKYSDLSDGVTEIAGIDFGIKYSMFIDYLLSDTLYPALGMLTVFFLMWIYIGSIFITIMTMVSIMMSLVFAYFFYVVVFRLVFFPFMNLCAIILLVGIGADDTFVFCDIWKKLRFDKPHTPLLIILIETSRHAVLTMFVTSFTTAAAFYVNALSSITAIRCFAIYAGTAIIINFVLTMTWLPAVVVIHDFICRKFTCMSSSERHENYHKRNHLNEICIFFHKVRYQASEYSRIFFEKLLPCIIIRLRIMWLLILFFLAVAGAILIFVAPGLSLPTVSEFQLLQSTHPFERYDLIYKHLFWFEKQQDSEPSNSIPVNILFGIRAVDNGNHWDPDDTGHLVLDDTLDISSPESQEWMYQFCQRLRKQTFYKPLPGYHPEACFMEGFRDWMARNPCLTSTGVDVSPCCNKSTFPYTKAVFEYCLKELVLYLYEDLLIYYDQTVGGPKFHKDDDRISIVLITFEAEFNYSVVYGKVSNFWNSINDWLVKELETAPDGLKNGWAIADENLLAFYDLQHNLAIGTPHSLMLSVSIATIVLFITTRNTLITCYAMLSVSGAIFLTIGVLVLLGWELNILESVIISVAVGLSIDFTVHYGVAYQLAQEKDRESRVIFSVSQMGCAITMAALTTFSAGVFMMPSTILSYTRMGIFLMLIMTITWVYSTFFFQSVCHFIGPEKGFGQLASTCCRKACCKRSYSKHTLTTEQSMSLQSSSIPRSSDSVELECLHNDSLQTMPVFKSLVQFSPCVTSDRGTPSTTLLKDTNKIIPTWNTPQMQIENDICAKTKDYKGRLGEAAIQVLHPDNFDVITNTSTEVVLKGEQYLTRVYHGVPQSDMIPNRDPTLVNVWVPLAGNLY
ncbi:protein dispatched homolog 1-like [Anneissia japonica]|uniref:protein dispatched homolog 1-like n=1 Tax=Anneissia japonica TaxID=1529436 RepID=UPI0014256E93|nr:protein dispatched homolog 1-like [Anneissia japonica]